MDLSKHLEKAQDAIKRRNYKLAVQICGQLLSIQPDDGEARECLRAALIKKAEAKPTPKAIALIGGAPHLLTLAVCRLIGQHGAAAKAAERYLALDPLSESANLKLADSLGRAGCSKSALAVYRAYADAQPRCLAACRNAGALLYKGGEFDAALEMYERALKVDPRDQESLKARKNLAAEGALKSTGIAEARSSRELVKDLDAQQRVERSQRLQLSDDEVNDELTEVEGKLGERPDDIALLARAAELHVMKRDHQSALDCLERALQLAPDKHDLAERAGDLRLRLQEKRVTAAQNRGDETAAKMAAGVLADMRVAEFRRRVDAHPTDLGLRHQLGTALLETGALDEAIAELQQAVKDPRQKGEARLMLGRAFRDKGMDDLAMGQFEQALAAATADADRLAILYDMGSVAEAAGKPDDALRHFSRILEQEIGYRDVARRVDQLNSSNKS